MHGRLRRTARFIATTTDADRDQANALIQRVRTTHDGVTGPLPDSTPNATYVAFMGNYATKSVLRLEKQAGSSGCAEGHMVPQNPWFSGTFANESDTFDGYMVPNRKKPGIRAYLDGNFARREHPLRDKEYCVWDTELAGFGMRIQPTGRYFWFVRLRHRGKHRRQSLGRTDDVDAELARTRASACLPKLRSMACPSALSSRLLRR